jgi:hypothetical protein
MGEAARQCRLLLTMTGRTRNGIEGWVEERCVQDVGLLAGKEMELATGLLLRGGRCRKLSEITGDLGENTPTGSLLPPPLYPSLYVCFRVHAQASVGPCPRPYRLLLSAHPYTPTCGPRSWQRAVIRGKARWRSYSSHACGCVSCPAISSGSTASKLVYAPDTVLP